MSYKFTNPNRTALFGKSDYPPVREWSPKRHPVLCSSGWHIPSPDYLYKWVGEEAWEVEVQGAVRKDAEKSAHEQIRFIRQVPEWSRETLVEFIDFCISHIPVGRYSLRSDAQNVKTSYVSDSKWFAWAARDIATRVVNAVVASSWTKGDDSQDQKRKKLAIQKTLNDWVLQRLQSSTSVSASVSVDPLDSILRVKF